MTQIGEQCAPARAVQLGGTMVGDDVRGIPFLTIFQNLPTIVTGGLHLGYNMYDYLLCCFVFCLHRKVSWTCGPSSFLNLASREALERAYLAPVCRAAPHRTPKTPFGALQRVELRGFPTIARDRRPTVLQVESAQSSLKHNHGTPHCISAPRITLQSEIHHPNLIP